MKELRRTEQKLVKHGNSIHVSIPMSELARWNLEVGDTVAIVTTDEGILIQPSKKSSNSSTCDTSTDFFQEMERVMDDHDDVLKGLVDR